MSVPFVEVASPLPLHLSLPRRPVVVPGVVLPVAVALAVCAQAVVGGGQAREPVRVRPDRPLAASCALVWVKESALVAVRALDAGRALARVYAEHHERVVALVVFVLLLLRVAAAGQAGFPAVVFDECVPNKHENRAYGVTVTKPCTHLIARQHTIYC